MPGRADNEKIKFIAAMNPANCEPSTPPGGGRVGDRLRGVNVLCKTRRDVVQPEILLLVYKRVCLSTFGA